jgi:hypothetical protein
MLSKVSSEGLASYVDAGNIVEQTIGSIRTVGTLLMVQIKNDESPTNQFSYYNRWFHSMVKRKPWTYITIS